METFLTELVSYFTAREFKFFTADFDPSQVDRASLFTRLCVSSVNAVSFGVLGSLASGEGTGATNPALKSRLAEFSQYGEVVGIYLKFGQPVILVVVDGEKLSAEEILGRFILLHQTATNMRDFSLGLMRGGKLPVRTLVFAVFTSHQKAVYFKEKLSAQCKRFSLFNKVWVLPWTVDLERKRVFKYSGLPLTEFGEELLEKAFFD